MLAPNEDNQNLRCFDHKRRFGMDFLYPTQRYVNALTKPLVENRARQLVPNPIFVGETGNQRPKSQVVLAGIVGVPWQDIATDASREGPNLEYMNADELKNSGPLGPDPRRPEQERAAIGPTHARIGRAALRQPSALRHSHRAGNVAKSGGKPN